MGAAWQWVSLDWDRSGHRDGLIARSQNSIAAVKRDIRTKSGSALLGFIMADIRRVASDPQSMQVVMAGL